MVLTGWKEIDGFPNYLISRAGQVWSKTRKQVLTWNLTEDGYRKVWLYAGGKRFEKKIHMLVAYAFVPGYFPEATVDHLNMIKIDNRPENLRWLLREENSRISKMGTLNHQAKLTEDQVREIRKLSSEGFSSRKLAKLFDISRWVVQDITYRKTWKHIV